MCATFEISMKKHNLSEEDEKKIKDLFDRQGFLIEMTSVRILEEQKKRDRERILTLQKQTPKHEQVVTTWKENLKAAEPYELKYRQDDENKLLVTCNRMQEACLCDVGSEKMRRLFKELLNMVEEVYYDASSQGFLNPQQIFWSTDVEVSIENETYNWEPTMEFKTRVKVV